MKASEFDELFDKGDEILSSLEKSGAKRFFYEQNRVNVDIPLWMVHSLDKEAARLGVTRQSIIKLWLAERLEKRQIS